MAFFLKFSRRDAGKISSQLLLNHLKNNCFFKNWKSYSIILSGIDHALLRQANHSIMTYGSFGMWGALLNQGGKIVIPRTHIEYETLKYMLKANLSNIVVI